MLRPIPHSTDIVVVLIMLGLGSLLFRVFFRGMKSLELGFLSTYPDQCQGSFKKTGLMNPLSQGMSLDGLLLASACT